MDIPSIGKHKEFALFEAIQQLKEAEIDKEGMVKTLLVMVVGMQPVLEEERLIEYLTALGLNLKTPEDFELASFHVTYMVACGGILVENRLSPSLVLPQDSAVYISAHGDEKARRRVQEMHDSAPDMIQDAGYID